MIPPELVEAVAREACKQMGLDADEPVDQLMVGGKWEDVLRWQQMQWKAREAIAFARAVKLCDTEGGENG